MCEQSFDNNREFIVQTKNERTASVRVCRDSQNNWLSISVFLLLHENEEGKGVVENPDMMKRLSMMEVFSEKKTNAYRKPDAIMTTN